ncbi:MAG: transcriptional repressor LexA [Treponema sp.]|jgi:repressor LexA|nr:transcriptional repressor LexA [Treponema sp.]
MKEPTERQQEVLDFIAEYIRVHTYPPTIRELADHFAISVKGAHDHVTALKKKGLLRQGDKKSRTMELVNREGESDFMDIPVLGTVAAGRPILCEENRDGFISLPKTLLKRNTVYFALRVRGDSMEGAGIMDGDTAIIEQQNAVENGEIAVIMLDDAVTLKTFYRESTRIRLQPENPKHSPIYCTNDVRILGRLAHILRSYNASVL